LAEKKYNQKETWQLAFHKNIIKQLLIEDNNLENILLKSMVKIDLFQER
jgi:hypothetical protein